MFNVDKPIDKRENDKLSRRSFSELLAEAILNYKQKDCFTIGIYGHWGVGKSSIINMMVDYFEEKKSEIEIIKFNPWNYSDQNSLISEFFRHLSVKFDKSEYLRKHCKGVSTILKVLSYSTSALKYVPEAKCQIIEKTATPVLGKMSDFFAKFGNKNLDLDETKEKLNTILEKSKKKILIIIDDIDRLNSSEIRQIFQLVKSLADFKNVIYLLSFDKNIVASALKDTQKGFSGYDYLEKIINVPFEIPVILKEELKDLLFQEIEAILNEEEVIERIDVDHLNTLYEGGGLNYFFENIRDINRFINTFRFSFPIVKNEVNINDFIAITAIQVFEPDLYELIKYNKSLFCSGRLNFYGQVDSSKRYYIEFNNNLKIKDQVKLFLVQLFPEIKKFYDDQYLCFTSNYKNNRISDLNYFDIYFKFSISKGEITSEKITQLFSILDKTLPEVEEQLKSLNEPEFNSFTKKLKNYQTNYETRKFLENITRTQFLNLFQALFNRALKVNNNNRALFDDFFQNFYDYLFFTKLKSKFMEIIEEFIDYFSDNLWELIYFVRFGIESNHIDNLSLEMEKNKNTNKIKDMTLVKLKAYNKDLLFKKPNLLNTIFHWKLLFPDEEPLKSYLVEIFNDEKLFIKLLEQHSELTKPYILDNFILYNLFDKQELIEYLKYLISEKKINDHSLKIASIYLKMN